LSDVPTGSILVVVIGDRLYRRLPRETVRNGKVGRGAFYFRGAPDPSASVDLAPLTTPETTRLRAEHPDRFGVGELPGRIPLDLGLSIRHDPTADNLAHCLIEGVTTKAICQTLADHTAIVIAPPD
jgi:hypothetical protein